MSDGTPPPPVKSRLPRLPWAIVGALALALAVVGALALVGGDGSAGTDADASAEKGEGDCVDGSAIELEGDQAKDSFDDAITTLRA